MTTTQPALQSRPKVIYKGKDKKNPLNCEGMIIDEQKVLTQITDVLVTNSHLINRELGKENVKQVISRLWKFFQISNKGEVITSSKIYLDIAQFFITASIRNMLIKRNDYLIGDSVKQPKYGRPILIRLITPEGIIRTTAGQPGWMDPIIIEFQKGNKLF